MIAHAPDFWSGAFFVAGSSRQRDSFKPMPDFTVASVVYCVLLGCIFGALWVYHERRSHAGGEKSRGSTAFHCLKCDSVYASHGVRVGVSSCPRCGRENTRLRF